MLGYPQRFKHSIFVVARERECIWICHNRKDSQGDGGGKGENEDLRHRSSLDVLIAAANAFSRERIGAVYSVTTRLGEATQATAALI